MAYTNPIMESFITAGCQYYNIDEKELLTSTSQTISAIRHILFYLIKKNTLLSKAAIGFRFGKTKTPVDVGINNISAQIHVYGQILSDCTKIQEKAEFLQQNCEKITQN